MAIRGTAGDDNLTGTAGNDNFLLWQGGNDTVDAGDGNDIIRMGATLTADDKIDGGADKDAVVLNGDYSAGLVFNADTITNVEVLSLAGGHSYNLTMNDGNVAGGQALLIKADGLGSGDSLTFDGSAETDGQFGIIAGAGDDTLTGGALGDHFHLESGGVDTVHGGGGNDVFYLGDQLWSDDQIDGGAGTDTVHVTGFAGGDTLVLTGTTMQNVEDFVLDGGTFLGLVTDDATVAAGATLTVDASAQTTDFLFDGSAETDGRFVVIGGSGDDDLTGGAGADTFHLENGGTDTVHGGDGADRFFMGASLNSADQIEGGAGIDTVFVDGGAAVTFTATTLTDVERIVLGAGHSDTFVENDATVAAGKNLIVNASALGAGFRLSFNGSAETDGTFSIIGGAGNDIVSGGLGADRFHLENGGNDNVNAGGGNDLFYMGAALTAADQIKGGLGYDVVILDGGAPVTFSATTMSGVEEIDLTAGHSYSLTTDSATVAFNAGMLVDASALGAGDTLTFNGAAEIKGYFYIIGGAGNDVITGGQDGDYIDLSFGGNDTVTLGSTISIFPSQVYMGAALTAADHIDGSAGFDLVFLQGDYTGANAVVFDAATMVDIDFLELAPGFSYDLTTNDGNVSAGGLMEVDGFLLGAGDSLKFDGSAETDGSFFLNDGLGNDVLKGGGGSDFLSFDGGGTDTGAGGGGDDYIDACGHFDVTDQFDGGTGTDTIELTASDAGATGYTGANALVLTASMMSNIEVMDLDPGGSYDITTVDANVAAGSSLTVDGSILDSGDSLTFDGSAETDGTFHFIAGASLQTHLTGGAGNDTFDLTLADPTADTQAFGNGGNDTFQFLDNFDSSSQIIDGGTGTNTLSLDGDYSAISLVGSGIIDNIQTVTFTGGHSYTGIQVFDDVAGGGTLTLDTTALLTGDAFGLDASLSSNAIHLLGGAGTYTVTGSVQNDTFDMGADFTALDAIDGGDGTDTVNLDGDYSAANALVFTATTMTNVEYLVLGGGHSYDITTDDATVVNATLSVLGGDFTIDGSALGVGDVLTVDASAETGAESFTIIGGAGDDTITGPTNGNHIVFDLSQGGNDTATGNNAAFAMGGALTATDQLDGGAAASSTVKLDGDYSSGLVFADTTIANMAEIDLAAGHSYNLTTADGNVAAGHGLGVKGIALGAGDVLTFDGSAETDGGFYFVGGAGNDVLTGGSGLNGDVKFVPGVSLDIANEFDLSAGGEDTAHGGSGSDVFYMEGALDSGDTIDGGAGVDAVFLTGDYTGANAVVFGATTMQNVEYLGLHLSNSYDLTTNDATVAAGQTLTVDASLLHASDTLTFDGSAETDGSFDIISGAGDDVLTGGALADTFDLTLGGNDTAHGGDGSDTFNMGAALTAADSIDGGDGNDTLELGSGDDIVFGASTITNVETLKLDDGTGYGLTTNDGNVAAGATLNVDASALTGTNFLVFNGSAESDGGFNIIGGAGNDVLTGGNGLDGNTILGLPESNTFDLSHGGEDTAHGGSGNDGFVMGGALDSGDAIDGGAGTDAVWLAGDYTGANALVLGATTMTNVEFLIFSNGHSYDVTTNDATVAAGQSLEVRGSLLSASNTLTFDGSAETDGSFEITGGAGDDVLSGGALADTFDLTFGGNDTVHGGDGSDLFNMDAAFTAADSIDGGADSTDAVNLSGDYTGASAVVFGAATMTNVEFLEVVAGNSYDLTTDDATVAAGQTLTVDASALSGSDTLIFNGSAETDGTFTFEVNDPNVLSDSQLTGGAGDDTLVLNGDFFTTGVAFNSATIQSIENVTLTAGNSYALSLNGASVATGGSIAIDGSTLGAGDHFNFGFDTTGGGDSSYTLTGGAGDDSFFMLDAFRASDKIDGGIGGNDQIQINGDYTAGVTLNADTIQNIGYFAVLNGNSYSLTENDGNVAAGATMIVTGSILTASDYLHFYGAAETDGHFDLIGGAGDDVLEGGNMDDSMTGGAGADTFLYTSAAQSSSTTYDTITDFAAGTDHFDLTTAITNVFAVSGSLDSGGNFDTELSGLGVIQASGAAVLTVTGGTLTGHTFLVVDGNGDDIYTAGQDYVFDITNYTGTITTGDFI